VSSCKASAQAERSALSKTSKRNIKEKDFFMRGAVSQKWLWLLPAVVLVAAYASTQTCLSLGFSKGLWLPICPDGNVVPTVALNASGLQRGGSGFVSVSLFGNYTIAKSESTQTTAVKRFSPSVFLVTPTGEKPLNPIKSWEQSGDSLTAQVLLPQVNDGLYTLRAKVSSSLGETSVEVPLPLFAPARIHVLTDRPLYEPGNVVKFRALVLKGSDLSPLEERPGAFMVQAPNGDVLLEEKASVGPWGVVAGSFPLDSEAESGEWTVRWMSGPAVGTRTFTVKPFTLPRFRVEATASKPFFGRGERPTIRGTATYSSGAPVQNAEVEISWSNSGAWPLPTEWMTTLLPKKAKTNATGSFVLDLPLVPADLLGQSTLSARVAVTDAAKDRVQGSASVLLSQDAIAVQGLGEFEGGLVEGFNNRVFIKATTADGRTLEGASLNIKRLWEPNDKGTDAALDEDGVAVLNLDPGPAVNVVIPAQPFRPPPPTPKVTQQSLIEKLGEGDNEVSLSDRRSFDGIFSKLEPCAQYFTPGGGVATVALFVHRDGRLGQRTVPAGALGACLEKAVNGLGFSSGRERFFEVSYSFDDSELPRFQTEIDGYPSVPGSLQADLTSALLSARDCLPRTVKSGTIPRLIEWKYVPRGKRVELNWVSAPGDASPGEGVLSCIESRVKSFDIELVQGDEESSNEDANSAVGYARVQIEAPEKMKAYRPQDTIQNGYEFLITAKTKSQTLGKTTLFMPPGSIPDIRLRADKQIVKTGDRVTVEILRGPNFTGELPKTLQMSSGLAVRDEKVDETKRTVQFEIRKEFEHWAQVSWNNSKVVFFIQPQAVLSVSVLADKPNYRPGNTAHLSIETAINGKGHTAALGLFGVDDSLSQLVSLPGPDELNSLSPQVISTPAFAGSDAQALANGRIRGSNAAAATLLRVSQLPAASETEIPQSVSARTLFDPNEKLVDRFYGVLGELYAQVHVWETAGTQKMTPQIMSGLWNKSLESIENKGQSARDAYGRKLRLHRLPSDLLALTEPRNVVIDATRLPEDVQNWSQWVAKEQP
jgi:MG2 domain